MEKKVKSTATMKMILLIRFPFYIYFLIQNKFRVNINLTCFFLLSIYKQKQGLPKEKRR